MGAGPALGALILALALPGCWGCVAFSERIITTLAGGANWVHAIDVDGDGTVDVLSSAGQDAAVTWYENDGSFTKEDVITDSMDYANSVFAIDVDGDGDVDALSSGSTVAAWYENDGSQSFTQRIITTLADGAYSVFAIDIDGDGDVDALSVSFGDDTVAWYEHDCPSGQLSTADDDARSSDTATILAATLVPSACLLCVGIVYLARRALRRRKGDDGAPSAHEVEMNPSPPHSAAAADARELARLRAEKARIDAEAERVRARGDAEAAAAAREIERLRAEIAASRSAAATTTANPIAQAGSEVPIASPIGRVVGVVRSWSSGLLRQAPPTASTATAHPTCEVLDVEKPAPEAEQTKQPSGESPPPYAHHLRSFMPPRGIPGRSPRGPHPSGAFRPPGGIPAGVPPRAPPPYPGAGGPPRGIPAGVPPRAPPPYPGAGGPPRGIPAGALDAHLAARAEQTEPPT